MPIEFRCPQCQKLLRTPEASAGKKAKCPQCATMVQIPNIAPPEPSLPAASDPFPNFDPSPKKPQQSGVPDFSAWSPTPTPPKSSANPYASPTVSTSGYRAANMDSHEAGLPWETQPKSFKSFWRTTKMIFSSPSASFQKMKPTGGLGDQIIFAIIGHLIGSTAIAGYVLMFYGSFIGMIAAALDEPKLQAVFAGGFLVFAFVVLLASAVGSIVGAAIGVFLNGAILHLCLSVVGGAKQPFETTARVVAYVIGSTAMLLVIPCGAVVQGIFALVFTIVGLSKAHRIETSKAALAVFLPTLLCCGVTIGFYAIMFVVAAAGGGLK